MVLSMVTESMWVCVVVSACAPKHCVVMLIWAMRVRLQLLIASHLFPLLFPLLMHTENENYISFDTSVR